MKQVLLILFALSFFLCSTRGQSGAGYETIADTIEIKGKFPDGCSKPPMVFIVKYDNPSGDVGRIPVNSNGEFSHRMYVQESSEIVFRDGSNTYDFVATPKEKSYELQIVCNGTEKTVDVKDSPENKTYRAFVAERKKLKAELDTFKSQDLNDKTVFKKFQRVITDYQKEVSAIVSKNRGTFTADFLAAADKLDEKDFSSVEVLRERYLDRPAFGSVMLYNTFLAPRILSTYMDIVRVKRDTSFAPFEKLLNIASKSQDASKRLQLLLYDLFYKRKEEALLTSYIKWAETHPDMMVQLVVKARLQRLSKCVPGRTYMNIQLNDTAGIQRKLSESVSNSKVTLLVFYSPTCSHCKEELPHFIPLWEKYKDKGLKIFTVASNAEKAEWVEFVNERTSNGWINVMEEEKNLFNSLYVIGSFPTFILIDGNGKILSRLATVDSIMKDIPELLDAVK